MEGNNIEEIKAKTETLTEEFHTISAKMYQQAQQAQGGDPNNMGGDSAAAEEASEPKPDNVVDADYEVVDEDK
jgi:molecular chaperone DnaK